MYNRSQRRLGLAAEKGDLRTPLSVFLFTGRLSGDGKMKEKKFNYTYKITNNINDSYIGSKFVDIGFYFVNKNW